MKFAIPNESHLAYWTFAADNVDHQASVNYQIIIQGFVRQFTNLVWACHPSGTMTKEGQVAEAAFMIVTHLASAALGVVGASGITAGIPVLGVVAHQGVGAVAGASKVGSFVGFRLLKVLSAQKEYLKEYDPREGEGTPYDGTMGVAKSLEGIPMIGWKPTERLEEGELDDGTIAGLGQCTELIFDDPMELRPRRGTLATPGEIFRGHTGNEIRKIFDPGFTPRLNMRDFKPGDDIGAYLFQKPNPDAIMGEEHRG